MNSEQTKSQTGWNQRLFYTVQAFTFWPQEAETNLVTARQAILVSFPCLQPGRHNSILEGCTFCLGNPGWQISPGLSERLRVKLKVKRTKGSFPQDELGRCTGGANHDSIRTARSKRAGVLEKASSVPHPWCRGVYVWKIEQRQLQVPLGAYRWLQPRAEIGCANFLRSMGAKRKH